MKYRKKIVTVEAVILREDTWDEISEFVDIGKLSDGKPEGCYLDENNEPVKGDEKTDKRGLLIPYGGGVMIAKEGDYVVKSNGELYFCEPTVFESIYEEINV